MVAMFTSESTASFSAKTSPIASAERTAKYVRSGGKNCLSSLLNSGARFVGAFFARLLGFVARVFLFASSVPLLFFSSRSFSSSSFRRAAKPAFRTVSPLSRGSFRRKRSLSLSLSRTPPAKSSCHHHQSRRLTALSLFARLNM